MVMVFNQFPLEYEMIIRNDLHAQLSHIQAEGNSHLEKHNAELTENNSIFTSIFSSIFCILCYAFFGLCIGLVVGMIACTYVCTYIDDDWRKEQSAFPASIAICVALGAIFGIVSGITSIYAKKETSRRIQNLKNEAEKKIAEYQAQFEDRVKQASIKFIESELTAQLIDWMTEGYIKTILAAKREKHIQHICIPFSFNVYTDQVVCNLGTFDFNLNRYRELDGPLEQSALARVLASAIQLNIAMKFPKDVSGTDIVIDISFEYVCHRNNIILTQGEKPDSVRENFKHVATVLSYKAENGNYQPSLEW